VSSAIFLSIIVLVALAVGAQPRKSKPINLPQSEQAGGGVATGPDTAPVVITEYADFQCSACAQAEPIIQKILKEYEGKIRFVYRHFPLSDHRFATKAAMAAEAAREQGKFWDMYHQLYSNQRDWAASNDPSPFFEAYAKAINLNMDNYREYVRDEKGQRRIQKDLSAGEALSVTGTPTFFINQQGIKGLPRYAVFKTLIDTALILNEPTN